MESGSEADGVLVLPHGSRELADDVHIVQRRSGNPKARAHHIRQVLEDSKEVVERRGEHWRQFVQRFEELPALSSGESVAAMVLLWHCAN